MTFNEFLANGFIGHYFPISDSSNIAIIIVAALVTMVAAYLLGSINFAIIISGKKYKQDIRDHGSKNAGMTNMMRTYGKRAAALTLLGDALKAAVAGLVGYAILGQLGAYLAGCGCVFGHVFPLYYKFKGGKGVVTAAVSVLMCNPFVFLILFSLFVIIVLFTRYISLGSVMCMLIYPFLLNAIDTWLIGGCPYVLFAMFISLLIIFKHKDNIMRLRQGTESKFSFKKSVKPQNEQQD